MSNSLTEKDYTEKATESPTQTTPGESDLKSIVISEGSSNKEIRRDDANNQKANEDEKQTATENTPSKDDGQGQLHSSDKNGKSKDILDGTNVKEHSVERLGSGFQIIRIKERHGQFRKALPTMPLPLAVLLCLVNVLLPGIGTLISGFTVFCCGKTEYESPGKAFSMNIIAALLQIITLPILVGWIWSIVWGVTFITAAVSKDEDKEEIPQPQQV